MKNKFLSSTWLAGKYPEINSEINTSLPYLAIGDFFVQGEEANTFIEEINNIYNTQNCTVPEAIIKFSNIYDIDYANSN